MGLLKWITDKRVENLKAIHKQNKQTFDEMEKRIKWQDARIAQLVSGQEYMALSAKGFHEAYVALRKKEKL